MRWLHEAVYVLKRIRRARAEGELDDEIRGHLEQEIADNVNVGMSQADARRAAYLAFGNVMLVKEDSRRMWGLSSIEILWQDLRYGARMLLATPGPTAVAIVALGIGIGANTAVFSAVYGVLIKPLPFPDPGRLIVVQSQNARSAANTWTGASPADFTDWKAASLSLEAIAAERGTGITLDLSGQPEQFSAEGVSDDFFKVFAVRPLLGRTLRPEEFTSAGSRALVLSYKLWRERFNANPVVVGTSIVVDGKPATVAGVMPAEFRQPEYAEAWVPLQRDSGEMQIRGARYFHVTGRLKNGTTQEQAQAELSGIAGQLQQQYPESDKDWSVRVVGLKEAMVGQFRPALLILLSAVGLVLLTACVNVANLQLARGSSRRREIAIRGALGAPRTRIIRQLVTESAMLAFIGAGLGLALSYWIVGAIPTLVPKSIGLPRLAEVRLDAVALLFTTAVSVVTGIVFGLAPGWHISRTDLQSTLKESGRSVAGGRSLRRARTILVVAEMTFTLMLLAGAGLLVRSFLRMQNTNNAYDPHTLLTARIPVVLTDYGEEGKRADYYRNVLSQVQSVPGVQSASLNSGIPLGFYLAMQFAVEGRPIAPSDEPRAAYSSISSNYFRTMRTPLISGREFTDQDNLRSPRVAIINESLRERIFPGEDPVGRRLKIEYLNGPLSVEIVGVVADIKQAILRDAPSIEVYVPYLQTPWLSSYLIVRTAGEPASVSSGLQQAIWDASRAKPLPQIDRMDEVASLAVSEPRFYAWMLGGLALMALGLASIGVYGIVSHSVVERTHEIGVKMALGAGLGNIAKQVMRQSAGLAGAGVILGLSGSFAVTRLLSGILYGVSSTDPLTFVTISAILATVALIASLVPARRAARVDPVVALRHE
jgi:putative ABC transport system permease protein